MPGRTIALLCVSVLLAASVPGVGWHEPDDKTNEQYGSTAGDPRVLEDAGACINETRPMKEVSCVVFYAHFLQLHNPVLMNTQRPPECAPNLARGFTGSPNVEPHWTFTRLAMYSSPGFVEYDEIRDPCEITRSRNDGGLARDIDVAKGFPIRGHWYLSADQLESSTLGIGTGPDSDTPSMGTMPCVTLRMTLETGRYVGEGELLTEGETTKTIVSTPYASGLQQELPLPDPCPGSTGTITAKEVAEFIVEMEPPERAIRSNESFAVGVHWYQHDGISSDPQEEDNINQADWNIHTGSDYPNRLVVPVQEPIEILHLDVMKSDEKSAIALRTQTPWGLYDIDDENIQFRLYNETGTLVSIESQGEPRSPMHCGHFHPLDLRYPWDLKAQDLEPGTYTLHATVSNWQHTGHATQATTFTIEEEVTQAQGLPAVAPLLVVFALFALLARLPRATNKPETHNNVK